MKKNEIIEFEKTLRFWKSILNHFWNFQTYLLFISNVFTAQVMLSG